MIRVFYKPCGKSYKEQHAAAYELLYAASDICGIPYYGVEKTKDGKPYFVGSPDAFFSIAHGNSYAVVAIGDKECGVDIEGGREISPRISKRYLGGAQGKEALILWTQRESFGKLDGKGFFAKKSNKKVVYKSFDLGDSVITVCAYEGTEISDKLESI